MPLPAAAASELLTQPPHRQRTQQHLAQALELIGPTQPLQIGQEGGGLYVCGGGFPQVPLHTLEGARSRPGLLLRRHPLRCGGYK